MWISSWWERRHPIDAQSAAPTIDDLPPQVTSAIEDAVHKALAHLTGVWTVAVQPTPERGRWRVELRSPLGRHVWTCLARAERLPDLIDANVRRFVRVASTHYHIRMLAEARAATPGTRKAIVSSTYPQRVQPRKCA
jgi:hypothetical protein